MSSFDTYANRYERIRMRREDGILEMTFHTDGGPLRWGKGAHEDLERAFLDVGRDRDNEIIIITGTGREYAGPAVQPSGQGGHHDPRNPVTAEEWDKLWYWEGKHLLMNLLNIEVPMIAAINGPATRHAEIPLLCDIVLASDDVTIQDSAHFNGGLVPGDGVHVVFPLLLGPNRGRYFLLTGQVLSSGEAKNLGLVNEVLAREDLLPRAWVLARQMLQRPPLLRRYTRVMLTQDLKKRMVELLGYGLALEGLAAVQPVR
ncbi:enoyl-CoA hydratase/isomerase family protein [Faunimonas sp. B44]|uniref:enoyl-CoA hydratase/isomerase family protein n=1 Tax=Faunimonas sp. B44 TaxID=3461493 RepID=UPI004044A827